MVGIGPAPSRPLPHRATPHLNLICCLNQCGLYIYCDLFTNILNAVFLCTVNFFRVNFFQCGLFLLCTLSWRIIKPGVIKMPRHATEQCVTFFFLHTGRGKQISFAVQNDSNSHRLVSNTMWSNIFLNRIPTFAFSNAKLF